MKIVFLGAPGAGKGTQAHNVSKRLGIPRISTGDILRDEIERNTPIGKKIVGLMERGMLVPDNTVIEVLSRELRGLSSEAGFILDGYPRNLAQAENCEMTTGVIDKVIYVEIPDEIIVERMSGRRTCPHCGQMYHLSHSPPIFGGLCDYEGERLVIRSDDTPDIVRYRLDVFHVQTEPIIEFYKKRDLLSRVDGTREINTVTDSIIELLKVG
jgi:adenylate kinase